MAWVRRVRTASGATAVQIAESVGGRRRIVRHVGSANGEIELGLLVEEARRLLADDRQGVLDLGIRPVIPKAMMVPPPAEGLFAAGESEPAPPLLVPRSRVLKSCSALLHEALAGVYSSLGFDTVGDEVFRDLVIARVVEPTSLLDIDRVLAEMGRVPASLSTRKRTLRRCHKGSWRDDIATACFTHARNRAETFTIVPIVKQFQERHELDDLVVVADAGMLSASNLREIDEADVRFIVGSRVTKAPKDLESHFRWHGDAFSDGQIIDTITPRTGHRIENDPRLRAEPVWDPGLHPGSWRAVWAFSGKRAFRDNKTLTLQERRAKAVVAGEKTARTPRFVKTKGGAAQLDEASIARARRLVGLKGYVTNIDARIMPPTEVINSYHDLWRVEESFRMSKTDLRARPLFARTRDAIKAHLTIVFTALGNHRNQRRDHHTPTRPRTRTHDDPQRTRISEPKALTRMTQLRSVGRFSAIWVHCARQTKRQTWQQRCSGPVTPSIDRCLSVPQLPWPGESQSLPTVAPGSAGRYEATALL